MQIPLVEGIEVPAEGLCAYIDDVTLAVVEGSGGNLDVAQVFSFSNSSEFKDQVTNFAKLMDAIFKTESIY